jgi:methylmalonyl-CoA mutase
MKRKDFSKLSIQHQNEKISYFNHEDFIAGVPPYTRGLNATTVLKKQLTIQLFVNFSSPVKSNTFIKENVDYKSIILEINTLSTINSGIYISSIEDMKLLLKELPLHKLSITLSSKNSILIVLGLFIAASKQLGFKEETLNLSVNYNYKNALINSNFYFNTIETILSYSTKNLSKFKTISISAFQLNTTSGIENELAFFLAEAYENLNTCILNGVLVDAVASKISFNYKISGDHLLEISKMRAARLLWAKMIHLLKPKQQHSFALQIHSTQNFSNYHKVFSAILGGAQRIISNKNTFLIFENETHITKTIDPWAGSTFIEKTTEEISINAWALFEKILSKGGFSQLIAQENLKVEKLKDNSFQLIIEAAKHNATIKKLNSIILKK